MLDLWNGAPIDPAAVYAPSCSENGLTSFTPEEIVGDIARLRAGLGDLRFTVESWVAAGDWHLLRMSAEGVHLGDVTTPLGIAPPSGRRLRIRGFEAFQVRDDQIVAVWLTWDWSEAYAALGARIDLSAGARDRA